MKIKLAAVTLPVLAEALSRAALTGDSIACLRIYHSVLSFGVGHVPFDGSTQALFEIDSRRVPERFPRG